MDEQDDLKTRLMNEIEAVIDRLLVDRPAPEGITLQYAEDTAVAVGEKVKEVVVQGVLADHREQAQAVTCPGCGQALGMKDYRSRLVATVAGEVKITRAYYYCADCKRGTFPPG